MSTNIWNGIFHSCSTKKLRPFWYYSHEISYSSTCMLMLGQPREVSLSPGRILPVPLGCSQRVFGCFLALVWFQSGAGGLWSQPGNGRGSAAVALPWQDAVLRRSAGLGQSSQLEKQTRNSSTSRPPLLFHPQKMKKETVRGISSKFSVSHSLVSHFSLIWWRGTFYIETEQGGMDSNWKGVWIRY